MKTRSYAALAAISAGLVFAVGAAILGLFDGTFNELQTVWNVFGPIAGMIVSYHFSSGSRTYDSNDAG